MRSAPSAQSDLNRSLWMRFAAWLSDYWPQVLSLGGGIGMASFQVFAPKDWGWIFWTSAGVFAIGGIGVIRQTPRISKLQEQVMILMDRLVQAEQANAESGERLQLASRSIVDPKLKALATKLNFTGHERISVYRNAGEVFSMLGRYSETPKYNEQGRRLYPGTGGCIGVAYHDREAFDDNITDPALDISAYCSYMETKWQIKQDVCRAFTMRSRNIAAFALLDSTRTRIGVIVFESVDVNRLKQHELRAILLASEGQEIAQLAEHLQIIGADIRNAAKEEF